MFAPWAVAGNSPAYGGGIVYGLQPGPVGSQVRQLQQQQARQPLPVWTANGLFGPAVYQPPGQPVGRAIPSGYRGNGKVTPVRDQRQRPTAKSGRRPRTSKAVTARPAKRQKQDVDAEIRQFVQRDKHMQRMFFDSALHNDNDEDDGDDDTDNTDTVADQNEYVGKWSPSAVWTEHGDNPKRFRYLLNVFFFLTKYTRTWETFKKWEP